ERSHCREGRGQAAIAAASPVPAQPEEPAEVHPGGRGRGGREAIGGIRPCHQAAPGRAGRHEREDEARAARGARAVDLRDLSSRQPAAEQCVDAPDARGYRRKPPVLAAQGWSVLLQPAAAQQVLEGGFQGRGSHSLFLRTGNIGFSSTPVKRVFAPWRWNNFPLTATGPGLPWG